MSVHGGEGSLRAVLTTFQISTIILTRVVLSIIMGFLPLSDVQDQVVRTMKLRFKLRRMKTPFESVDAGEFVGFVRGLNKLTSCKVLATIEDKTTAEHFVIDVRPLKTTEKWVNFARRQAESYGVIVEVIDEVGD